MYQIKCDGYILYDPRDDELTLISPKCKLVANGVGEASFTITNHHPYYNIMAKMKSIVEIRRDEEILFRGRIVRDTRDLYNRSYVEVEGVLGFTNDTVIKPFVFPDDFNISQNENAVKTLIEWVIEQHNSQAEAHQKLKVGNVTVTDPNNTIVRSSDEYTSTWEILKTKFFDSSLGGYICARYEEDGTYVDYLADFAEINQQHIVLAENILDISKETDAAETYTVCIPMGTEITEDVNGEERQYRITLDGIADGNLTEDIVKKGEFIYSRSAVEKYGWICAPVETTTWDDVTLADRLKTKAVQWLENTGRMLSETITAKALDLNLTDKEIEKIKPFKNVTVYSEPHGIYGEIFPLTEMEIDIQNPQNTEITIGKKRKTLVDGIEQSRENAINRVNEAENELKKLIGAVDVEYYLSDSKEDLMGGAWSTEPQEWVSGKFMWSRTKLTKKNNEVTYRPSEKGVCIAGAKGENGKGILSISEEYYLSTSKFTQSGGGWLNTPPTWMPGMYMWTRSKIVYTDSTQPDYTTPICDSSWEAVNDIVIGGRNLLLDSGKEVTSDRYLIKQYIPSEWLEEGETYTAQVCLTPDSTVTAIKLFMSNGMSAQTSIATYGTGKQSVKATFTAKYYQGRTPDVDEKNGYLQIFRYPNPESAAGVTVGGTTIHWIKLEKGNKATDWTPAIEDTNAAIDNALTEALAKNSTYYSNASPEGNTHKKYDIWYNTADGNKMHYWNGLEWVAVQYGPSAISADAIYAEHINVEDLRSVAAKIGGWDLLEGVIRSIGANNLYSGIGRSGYTNFAFFAGSESYVGENAVFRVGHDGVLTATNANITGDITANSFKLTYGNYIIWFDETAQTNGMCMGIMAYKASGMNPEAAEPYLAEGIAITGDGINVIGTTYFNDSLESSGHIRVSGTNSTAGYPWLEFKIPSVYARRISLNGSNGRLVVHNYDAITNVSQFQCGALYSASADIDGTVTSGHHTIRQGFSMYIHDLDNWGLNVISMTEDGGNLLIGNGSYYHKKKNVYYNGNNVYLRAQSAIYSNKTIQSNSDARLKHEIVQLPSNYMDMYMDIEPVRFYWNDDIGSGKQMGVIAQQVLEAMQKHGIDSDDCNIVRFSNDTETYGFSPLTVNYEFLNTITMAVVQNHENRIKALEAELAQLKSR